MSAFRLGLSFSGYAAGHGSRTLRPQPNERHSAISELLSVRRFGVLNCHGLTQPTEHRHKLMHARAVVRGDGRGPAANAVGRAIDESSFTALAVEPVPESFL